ncbi:MAG: heavy metal translocating P-type ATPase [Bacteroidales bacterium]
MHKENIKTPCYHCGEDCGTKPVVYADHEFCCNGCRTVYEILSNSQACEYYSFNDTPGVRVLNKETGNRFSFLDEPEIKSELLLFSDGGISSVRFYIPTIHCSSCIWLLENLHRLNDGIIRSNVLFAKKEVTITFSDQKISLRQVVEILASVNYVPQISMDDLQRKQKKKDDYGIIFRLGVAGFCFGNIMLFSFPEYLSASENIETFIRDYLRWLNLLFSLPVLFYSGSVYLISAYKGIRQKFISIDVPIAVGMIALFLQSAYEIISGTGSGYMDSLSGLVFFLLVGKWYQGKTYEALSFDRDYKSYFPVSTTAIDDDGKEHIILIRNLKAGTRILIRNQELIPADAYLIKGEAHIDYSFVSGESIPVHKNKGDKIFAGGRQLGGAIELNVEKEVDQSYLTKLWNQNFNEKSPGSGMSELLNLISRRFTFTVLIIAALTALGWMIIKPSMALMTFTSVLIVACPCALALSIPFTYGNTMRIFGKNGFYLKSTDVVESLANITQIIFDKTGTITQNDAFELSLDAVKASREEISWVKSLVRHSTHPVSIALYNHLPADTLEDVEGFTEITAKGISGTIKGISIVLGSPALVGFLPASEIPSGNQIHLSIDGKDKGYFRLSNTYRPGLEKVIKELQQDYSIHLLSGDNEAEMSRLLPLFGSKEQLHFKQSPFDKLNYVKDLRDKGEKVLMIGDGLNDAGALQASNVGISIADKVYHFSPACEGILDSGQFNKLAAMIRFTRTNVKIVKASIIISLIYNITGISVAVAGLLQPVIAAILMPASSVTVVVFVTLSTSFWARRKEIN